MQDREYEDRYRLLCSCERFKIVYGWWFRDLRTSQITASQAFGSQHQDHKLTVRKVH